MTKTYIEKHSVVISVSIVPINTIKSLGELDVTTSLADRRIHHKAHSLSKSLTVVDVMITIQVEHVWGIGQDC